MTENLPFCSVCSTQLEPRFSRSLLIWVHVRHAYGTHEPRMVPLYAIESPILFCTFCGAQDPTTVQLASTLDPQVSDTAMRFGDKGVWFTCRPCAKSVRKGDADTLTTRLLLANSETLARKESRAEAAARVADIVRRVVRTTKTHEWLTEWWATVPRMGE